MSEPLYALLWNFADVLTMAREWALLIFGGQKSMQCSAHLEASSGPKAEGVPTSNKKGGGSGHCLLWGGLDKARNIVPTALLVRVQCFKKDLSKAVDGPSIRPIILLMITGSYFRRRKTPTAHNTSKQCISSLTSSYRIETKSNWLKFIYQRQSKCIWILQRKFTHKGKGY